MSIGIRFFVRDAFVKIRLLLLLTFSFSIPSCLYESRDLSTIYNFL